MKRFFKIAALAVIAVAFSALILVRWGILSEYKEQQEDVYEQELASLGIKYFYLGPEKVKFYPLDAFSLTREQLSLAEVKFYWTDNETVVYGTMNHASGHVSGTSVNLRTLEKKPIENGVPLFYQPPALLEVPVLLDEPEKIRRELARNNRAQAKDGFLTQGDMTRISNDGYGGYSAYAPFLLFTSSQSFVGGLRGEARKMSVSPDGCRVIFSWDDSRVIKWNLRYFLGLEPERAYKVGLAQFCADKK